MPSDSDPILIISKEPDSITDMIADSITHIPYKLYGMMFIVFVFLSSDVFTNRIMSNFHGAVDYKCLTSWGVVLQGIFLVIAVICLDALIQYKII